MNQEIEVLKERLATKQASEYLSGAGSAERNKVVDVNSTSHETITLSGGVSETSGSHNESTCSNVANVEIPHVNSSTVVSASEMPINRDSLSELSLPAFVNCDKQSVVTFIRDLDVYFELKRVPENLKLSLVLRAIKDPVAQNWVRSEYYKIDSYQSFKPQFSKLFWNEMEQSRFRCDIYQGKYDRNGGEPEAEPVSDDVQRKIAKAYETMKRKIDIRKKRKKKGKAHWKSRVNDKVLLRTQPVSDATAGVTAKFVHPYEGPYVIARIIPPSTFELADGRGRVRGQFNKRVLKAYKEATKGDELKTEDRVRVQSDSRVSESDYR